MAQVKLLLIANDGVPQESQNTDEITFASFSVSGGGPVLSGTGLDMTNQDIINVKNLLFFDPATGYINQTAGNLIIDNIMRTDLDNLMGVSGSVIFPIVPNTGTGLDAFQLPQVSGVPTATPTNSSAGTLVYDYVNGNTYVWTGTQWDNMNTVAETQAIVDAYVAGEILLARDAVYISAANTVSKADANNTMKSRLLGFAKSGVASAAPVEVIKFGKLGGFSGMTPGAREYLSPTTPGLITETIPTGNGQTIVQAGYANTNAVLDIQIQQLGRRA